VPFSRIDRSMTGTRSSTSRPVRLRRLLPLAALLAAAALPAPALAADLLPDLDQEQPDGVEVTTDTSGAIPRFHLGFDSAVDNVGAGPLLIDGHRASTDEPQMVADQTIQQTDGSTRTVPDIGRLQYVYSSDHQHWHYLGFDHYELRRASDYKLIAPDQKTGFCLGDRYDTHPDSTIPGEPPQPVYTGYCGRGQTDLLSVGEGISVGYGDVYYANLEGQFVDLTGAPAGEYYLVHRVNADHKLLESDYTNDAASLLLDLSWPDGTTSAPSVKVLLGCNSTDACPGPDQQPPLLTRAVAERYALAAMRPALGLRATGFTVSCPRVLDRVSRACKLRGAAGARRYSLRETIAYERTKQGVLFYRYTLAGSVAGGSRGARKVGVRRGRVRIGAARPSAAVAEPGKRLVALDHPLLDGIRLGPVVHEVPRLVRHALGGRRSGVPAQ
jgi:hypothetical protein